MTSVKLTKREKMVRTQIKHELGVERMCKGRQAEGTVRRQTCNDFMITLRLRGRHG